MRESADIRRLIRALNEASDKALNPDGLSSEELLDYAEQLVFKIAEARLRPGVDGRMAPLIGRVMERIREREKSGNVVPGLATGLTDLGREDRRPAQRQPGRHRGASINGQDVAGNEHRRTRDPGQDSRAGAGSELGERPGRDWGAPAGGARPRRLRRYSEGGR